MDLFEKNLQYIQLQAHIQALEIARTLKQPAFTEDYQQDLILIIFRKISKYNPRESSEKTWINIILHYAKIDIIRRETSNKRKINLETEDLHQAKNEIAPDGSVRTDIEEFIETIKDPTDQEICRMVILAGCKITEAARRYHLTTSEVLARIRAVMRPCARQIGIHELTEDGAKVTERDSVPTGTPKPGKGTTAGSGGCRGSSWKGISGKLRGK